MSLLDTTNYLDFIIRFAIKNEKATDKMRSHDWWIFQKTRHFGFASFTIKRRLLRFYIPCFLRYFSFICHLVQLLTNQNLADSVASEQTFPLYTHRDFNLIKKYLNYKHAKTRSL